MITTNRYEAPEGMKLTGTDLELQRRIVNYLSQRLPNITTIKVEIHDGTVILRGRVPSQSIQWRCLDCCRHVAGVLNVIDRLSS
jgi:osmotically-inducible protein OsmY